MTESRRYLEVAINGKNYTDWQAFVDIIQHSANVPESLTLLRHVANKFNVAVTR